jgi:ParB-like chromosome segregation protein Spo0J
MKENFSCAYSKLVPLSDIKPNPDNTNEHPRQQIELLAKIISYNGQRNSIVVSNQSGYIVKGHGRLLALQHLKWSQAAVDYQDYETPEHEYADMQADNRIAELSKNNEVKFTEKLRDFPRGFDLQLLGVVDIKKLLPVEKDTKVKNIVDKTEYLIVVECKD